MDQLERILLSVKVTESNFEEQIKLCQKCEDIIDDYKALLDFAVRCKKINKEEFEFLKKLKDCHAKLSDSIIEFATITEGYSVVPVNASTTIN